MYLSEVDKTEDQLGSILLHVREAHYVWYPWAAGADQIGVHTSKRTEISQPANQTTSNIIIPRGHLEAL